MNLETVSLIFWFVADITGDDSDDGYLTHLGMASHLFTSQSAIIRTLNDIEANFIEYVGEQLRYYIIHAIRIHLFNI